MLLMSHCFKFVS